jgi:hypothetical protein
MPGHGDRPVEEIAGQAVVQIDRGFRVWQKWTCPNCGSRQTMDEPDTFYLSGSCQNCGKVSKIHVCGFMLASRGAGADMIEQSVRNT